MSSLTSNKAVLLENEIKQEINEAAQLALTVSLTAFGQLAPLVHQEKREDVFLAKAFIITLQLESKVMVEIACLRLIKEQISSLKAEVLQFLPVVESNVLKPFYFFTCCASLLNAPRIKSNAAAEAATGATESF